MLSIREARARILAGLRPTGTEIVSLAEAAGRILAGPLIARLDQPAGDVSAMDGYALRASSGAAGVSLAVIGTGPAGHPFTGLVSAGEAVRVFTGSLIPDGSDAIVIQENAAREGDRVTIREAAARGRHIRPKGGDFAVGDRLIEPGAWLGARAIGLAASADHPWLPVARRPVVALLATGDEIVLPGERAAAGGLPSSNSFALAALVRAAGGVPLILPVARDDLDAIAAAALSAGCADMIVTLGGASVGDHDLVRPALARHGFEPDVWRIAMRPGKPMMHGQLDLDGRRVPVLGLPGNPVSALICGMLFLMPAIARLLGRTREDPPVHQARLGTALPANDQRADHIRAILRSGGGGERVASPLPSQDSSRLRDLLRADALILRAPQAAAAAAGDLVEILSFADFGI